MAEVATMNKCSHLSAAMRRHTSPGTLLLLLFFILLFGPRTMDALRGVPRIDNELTLVQGSLGEVLVRDRTISAGSAFGVRAVTIEKDDGSVVCATEHHNTWAGERNRYWRFSAFTACPAPELPFRVCSYFSVRSDSGRARGLGPFCSAYVMRAEDILVETP